MNKMQSPKVSVIIPVYNTEKYLHKCLDSVINQTLKDIEIICVDDGSTDGSLGILREYEKKDPRVRVFTQPNINAGAARNNGLSHAAGEYLSFLDADDFFEANMLEDAYCRAKDKNAEIVVFRCDHYFSETGEYKLVMWSVRPDLFPTHDPFSGEDVTKDFFKAFTGWAWDKLILHTFVEENNLRFQEQRTTNDLFFSFYALAKSKRITFLDKVLVHHRTTLEESLQSTRERSWDCFYNALVMLYQALNDAGLYEHYKRDFINYFVHFSLWNINSLSWPTQELAFYMLKTTWAKEFHIAQYDTSYFYNKNEYQEFCSILNKQYLEVYPNGRPVLQESERIAQLLSEYEKIQNSTSYKIGSAVTWLPGKVWEAMRRVREKGVRYTIQYIRGMMKGYWK